MLFRRVMLVRCVDLSTLHKFCTRRRSGRFLVSEQCLAAGGGGIVFIK